MCIYTHSHTHAGEYGGEASTYMTQTLPTNILEVETQIEAAGMDAKGA